MPSKETNTVIRDRKTILAVDDDMVILTMLRKILERGYDVCLAKSAESAMNILGNTGIDLILLDMEMPTMSGLEFLQRLRESKNHYYSFIPVIFVTSHGTKDVLIKATKSGANDFIVKPIAPKILLDKIESILRFSKEDLSTHDLLLKLLHLMAIACKSGNNTQIEKLAGEFKPIKYNYGTDVQIADVCRKALNFDYPSALRKITSLLKNNLYDLAKNNASESG